jgi:hypothetical protein
MRYCERCGEAFVSSAQKKTPAWLAALRIAAFVMAGVTLLDIIALILLAIWFGRFV